MKVCKLLVGLVALLVTFTVNAQAKHSGSLKCGKEDVEHEIDVGDQPGHVMWVEKGSCTLISMQPTMLVEGAKNKDYSYVDIGEATSSRAMGHGYGVHTTDSGDKYFVSFQGEAPLKDGKSAGDGHGTWSYTGGTGRLKGLQGKGTYKTIHHSDGTVTVEFVGEYQLPSAK